LIVSRETNVGVASMEEQLLKNISKIILYRAEDEGCLLL
jgi:hypothetical protein